MDMKYDSSVMHKLTDATEQRMVEAYEDPVRWNRMSLLNIARSGDFAADRAVREYADNIWRVPHR